MKLTGAKIWNSKNASLCRVFANRVTYVCLDPLTGKDPYQTNTV